LKSPLKTLKRILTIAHLLKPKSKDKDNAKMHQGEYPKKTTAAVEYET